MRTEITKSHLNNHICQHRGMKTSTVTPSFYYVFNISLYCNDTIPSFIGNLWRVLLLRNHLKRAREGSSGARSIRPKFPEIPVQIRMEQTFPGNSFRKFRFTSRGCPFFWKFEIPEISCSICHFYPV